MHRQTKQGEERHRNRHMFKLYRGRKHNVRLHISFSKAVFKKKKKKKKPNQINNSVKVVNVWGRTINIETGTNETFLQSGMRNGF